MFEWFKEGEGMEVWRSGNGWIAQAVAIVPFSTLSWSSGKAGAAFGNHHLRNRLFTGRVSYMITKKSVPLESTWVSSYFNSCGIANHLSRDLEIGILVPRLDIVTAGGNIITQRMRLWFTTANRARVEPFHDHFRNDSSARTDSAMPSRAVVSPAYQIYLFSSGLCANSQRLPVPD